MSEILLARIGALKSGAHASIEDGACAMEAVSFVAGEPWSDRPQCACPVIGAFLRSWNDSLPDNERDALLRPLIPRIIGTRGSGTLKRRRAMLAADWLIRVHTVAWLRLAKLDAHANALAGLPEITNMTECPSLIPVLAAVQKDADAAMGAAMHAARDAAWAAAMHAAGDAARDALNKTRQELQQSALELVGRMIEATDA